MHHMYTVGLDVDTRAYFTAATCAISFNKTLSVNTPLLFFNGNLYKKYYTNATERVNLIASDETKSTALTLWNKLLGISSHNRKSKITNLERNVLQLTPRVRSIIVGILLSDAWMNKHGHWNPRVGLKQSVKNFSYLWQVYSELAYLCSGPLFESKARLRGKIFYSWSFQTRQLPCFMEIFNLFYVERKGNIIKTIKPELFFYLDYMALAHWILQKSNIRDNFSLLDSKKINYFLYINVEGYTIRDIVLLINILLIRYGLSCSIRTVKNKQCIGIDSKSMPLLLSSIRPVITSMPNKVRFSSTSYRWYSKRSESYSGFCNPAMFYENADVLKEAIINENKGKIGVYRWVNLVSDNTYIGSSTNLGKRLRSYYSYSYITDVKRNMLIEKALLKYGYSNFKLEILEYCSKDEVLAREQYYLDLLKPEYNILKKAGSSLGFTHSEDTKALFRKIA